LSYQSSLYGGIDGRGKTEENPMMDNQSAVRWSVSFIFLMIWALVLAGCQSQSNKPSGQAQASAGPTSAAPSRPTIRVKAGVTAAYTDPDGVVWQADQGFDGGDTVARDPDLAIANTKDANMYRSERFGMAGYSFAVPNGNYTVKLHFAETYDGITGPGQRVFSFSVQGHEVKDLDLYVKAGGANRAYIETFDVPVTDGKLDIKFTPNIENPEINAIEIIPD
jgi:hypothetical protein